MNTIEQIHPDKKYSGLVVVSFMLGLMTIIFPIVSIAYLIGRNGGPGYLQSIFCGIPVALASIITGIVSLVYMRRKNQKGGWMAASGIVSGSLFFIISYILVFVLLAPYLSGTAH